MFQKLITYFGLLNMRFSLRQLATFVLFAALVLGLGVCYQQILALELENEKLRAVAGFNFELGSGDHYTLWPVGSRTEPGSPVYGSWLLRVDNHEKYVVEI